MGAENDDLREAEKQAKWAISSEGKYRLEAAVKLAQSERIIADSGNSWDRNPLLFGVANGVLDLRTGKLRQGNPSDRLTLHSDIRLNAIACCPRWLKFLREIFGGEEELIDFVQRAVGYCMTGDVNEQVLFMCYGTGANGKSTFLEVTC
jgi:putative DNA primase/helicase